MMKFSSGLLNYVESVNYNGFTKTIFYSDFGTNFQIGDKVFIVNGNYDSDTLIQNSNFSAGIDGYTILNIDKCSITLDIDYVGTSPYNEDILDNFIKVYHISTQREFDYINNITINSYTNSSFNKFEYGLTNNIIYLDSPIMGGTAIAGTYSGCTGSGFYQKGTTSSAWIPLIGFLGTSSVHFKTTGIGTTYSLTNNKKLLIIGEDINIAGKIFKQRGIYSFVKGAWNYDIIYNKAYISKLNFRNGKFNGIWNDGIFGSYINEIDWDSNNANWNSGIFLNSNWKKGTINSKTNPKQLTKNFVNTSLFNPQFSSLNQNAFNPLSYILATSSRTISYNSPTNIVNNSFIQSYYCALTNNKPLQSTDFSNNKGFGFNYIIDSNIEQSYIINGNFLNCNLGLTNYGINALDVYYGLTFTYNVEAEGGHYDFCDMNTVALLNANIIDSNILNSNIASSKLTSNQIQNTVASGEYNSDNGINVINSDLWGYTLTNSGPLRGILKLFISDTDLNRLGDFETIYIDNINKELYVSSFNDETKVYINLENKYIFDYFQNSELSTDKIVVSRKNINENLYKSYVEKISGNYVNISIDNPKKYASIDIDLGNSLAWYKDGINYIYTNPLLTLDNVSNLFSNTILNTSEFSSGILLNSTWKSGDNFNNIGNKIKLLGNNFDIVMPLGSTNSLYVKISAEKYNQYDTYNIGDYIWLSGIDYSDPSINVTTINSTFKVSNIFEFSTYRNLELLEITNVLNTLVPGGTFSVVGVIPNYVSVNKFKIENSTIVSGLFKTSLILNSSFTNPKFNNLNQSFILGNINQLRLINILLKNDNNIINNGLFYKSHILNTTWNGGISFNNILFGNTFSGGLFKNGYWLNGSFNDGIFADSNDIIASTASYDNNISGYYRSWRQGQFNNGQFYNSIWLDGKFNNGRFYNSTWYGGTFNNGILGLKNSSYLITTMGYYLNTATGSNITTFNNGIVESAIVGGSASVYWHNGKFNDGDFTSFTPTGSVWYDGEFNGGRFDGLAKWKNGKFNNGKFLSYYGWTLSNSLLASDYSWENGIFSGGQFGNQNTATNSTWFDGEFNGGVFNGRVWNYGIFTKGIFNGSALTQSNLNETNFITYYTPNVIKLGTTSLNIISGGTGYSIGNHVAITNANSTTGYATAIVTSIGFGGVVTGLNVTFGGSYYDASLYQVGNGDGTGLEVTVSEFEEPANFYGLWRNGFVVDSTHIGKPQQKIYTTSLRSTDTKKVIQNALLQNMVWQHGTFSHGSGKMSNSVWLDGSFVRGTFDSSAFNPYVNRLIGGGTSSRDVKFNFDKTCSWINGDLINSSFYISEWQDGTFNNGYMLGGIWDKGTWLYGTAENILWKSGTWKNGNWYGTNFNYKSLTGSNVTNDKTLNVLYNIASASGTSSIHILNAFTSSTAYNFTYNNKLYKTNILTSDSITLPLLTYSASDISVNYGNGSFVSGIWENGIWNNGWRDDTTLTRCELFSVASYVKVSKYSHRVQLQLVDGTCSFGIGDYVSAGNLIGIDVNGNRKLLKDKFSVIFVNNNSIVLEYALNSPILEIIKDSVNHIIYLSKNVWLSGGFLNGRFKGIWNYGLFKGFPHITYMEDTHWIDGVFDGGHFKGYTSSANIGISTPNIITYNTALIQNFTFKDNNIASATGSMYQSWIDVNYPAISLVNLNKPSKIYRQYYTGFGYTNSYFGNTLNLYGSPTFDVLSSKSSFRDSNSLIVKDYSLGYKINTFTNFIPNNGNFSTPVSTLNPLVGINNFNNAGWTFSGLSIAAPISIVSNMNGYTSEVLGLSGSIVLCPDGDFYANGFILGNTNIQTERNRYYMAQITITQSDSIGAIVFGDILDNPNNFFNHTTTTNTIKTEYFYNIEGLNLYVNDFYSSIMGIAATYLSINISNISFYEVDQIPFFQYTLPGTIDPSIRAPLNATASYIDYTNANYNYIGNLQLILDAAILSNGSNIFNVANSGNILQNFNTNIAFNG